MKGKLFVSLYSVILIGLFGACCYLMTIVNPPRLPDSEARAGNDMHTRESLLPRDNPDYGLEKIPEGVDADEFRKNLMKKVTKYDLKTEQTPYETGKRVVPPIWPSDDISERNIDTQKNKESTAKEFKTFLPVKGHRRSVNSDKLNNLNNSPGSILLKIVDDSGHKKIEIKFISGENIKTKKLRKNRSPNQLKLNITKEKPTVNQSTISKNYNNMDEKVILIKADDVILLDIVDDSDLLLDNSVSTSINNTDNMQELLRNNTDLNYLSDTWNNDTKLVNLEEAEKKLKNQLAHTDMYTLNLLFNTENKTSDPRYLNTQEHKANQPTSLKILASFNDTGIPI